jgi:hypothetical protein
VAGTAAERRGRAIPAVNVFMAGVSSDRQDTKTIRSYDNFTIREGDDRVDLSGRPGWIARLDLCDTFLMDKKYDAILMVDMDMVIPEDGLERLRRHDKDMVTAHYFRRQSAPLMSICQIDDNEKKQQVPMVDVPSAGLHEVASTGLGFVLIKREVLEAVAKIPHVQHPIAPGPVKEMGWDGIYGQDVRFFFYARKLGYKLWLDANVECKHATTFYTSKYLYDILRPHQEEEWKQEWERIEWVQKQIIKSGSKNWKRLAAPFKIQEKK